MLSTSVIKNVADASHYYSSQDNYYTRDEGVEHSEWWGNGAQKLKLQGEVDPDKFIELLNGQVGDEKLGKMVDGEMKHRSGWDLTFSAPKSVSLMALIGDDKRLVEAHKKAVNVALAEIERGCAEVRTKVSGDINYQHTKNLIAAQFHHDLSRAQDPQLHTHNVVMNITERKDGKWRSQASKMGRYDNKIESEVHGFIERVRHNKRYYGKLYESELAFQVKELGYDIVIDPETKVFEIAGVNPEAIKFFSKRRNQIENYMEEHGLSSGRAADVATLKTRTAKSIIGREDLLASWKNDSMRLGLDYKSILNGTYEKNKNSVTHENSISLKSVEAIKLAAKELSQFKPTFALEEIIMHAADLAIEEKINVESLFKGLDSVIETGDLIKLENNTGKTTYMEKSTLNNENKIKECLENKTALAPKITEAHFENFIGKPNEFTQEEKQALSVLMSYEKYILFEGNAAREALPKALVKLSKTANLSMAIVSPNQITSKYFALNVNENPKGLWEQIKSYFVDHEIKAYSVLQFLNAKNIKIPDVLIIDNSHLLSAKNTANLLDWGKSNDTQLLFFGNKHVIQAQKVGVDTNYLVKHGIKTISLTEPKNSIANDIAQNNIKLLSQKIANHMLENKDNEERLKIMAKHYCKLPESKNNFLVANNKIAVETLNLLAHDELKEIGKIKNAVRLKVLLPQYLSLSSAKLAKNYQHGLVVRFNEQDKALKVNRGEYLRVISHDKDSNSVKLSRSNGSILSWQPDKNEDNILSRVELFKEKAREFCAGERISFHRSIKFASITKGEHATIQTISNDKIKIIKNNGKSVALKINEKSKLHFDYGYAHTLHSIAHERPANIIAEMPAKSFPTHQRTFYQVISQPKELFVYTDNKNELIATLEKKTGDRVGAHQILDDSDEIIKARAKYYDLLEKNFNEKIKNDSWVKLSKHAIDAVNYSIRKLSEREAGFSHKELILSAMQYSLGDINKKGCENVILAMQASGLLLKGSSNNGTLWTTPEAINIEREIIALCNQDKGKLAPIASDELIAKICNKEKLNSEQIAAVKTILQSNDRVLAIQGRAGTGKTTLMMSLADVLNAQPVLENQGYELQGVAPTHKAVKELKDRGIAAQTVDSFLVEMKKLSGTSTYSDFSHKVLVVDEASMVSNRKMLELLQISHALNFRAVIPTGDTRQFQSLEAGSPHKLIQTQVTPIKLERIRRQENEILKQAVKEIYDYDFVKAFNTLKNSIIEIGHDPKNASNENNFNAARLKRIGALAHDYISFKNEQRQTIQVITPGHDDRVIANQLIRQGLKEEHTLSGPEYEFPVLFSKGLSKAERSHIANFEVGQVLKFNAGVNPVIKPGEYLTVAEIVKNNILMLKNSNGREISWEIPSGQYHHSAVEVFKSEKRHLQVGDTIRWNYSQKQHNLSTGETAKVLTVNDKEVVVRLENQKVFSFNPRDSQYQHWDHGYAVTAYAAQGGTNRIVLAHLESFRPNLINQPAFLVAMTRAVDEIRIYTDNKNALLERIQLNPGAKVSGLEVVGQWPTSKTNQAEVYGQSPSSSHLISSEKIIKFATEQTKNETQKIKNFVDAYKELQSQTVPNINKSITKQKQFETCFG